MRIDGTARSESVDGRVIPRSLICQVAPRSFDSVRNVLRVFTSTWATAARESSDVGRQAPCLRQCSAQQQLNMGIGAAQFIPGPTCKCVVNFRIQSEENLLSLGLTHLSHQNY